MSEAKPKKKPKTKKPAKAPALTDQEKEEAALLAAPDPALVGLTPMQAAFVGHYIVEKNATDAAKKAGYSAKSASQLGYQLLQIPSVSTAIEKKFQMQARRLDLSADRVLQEIMRVALADISQAYDEEGNLKPVHEIPEDVRRAIVGIETETLPALQENTPLEGEEQVREEVLIPSVKKVKFADKNRALELLAKHLKLLTEKVEHTHAITLEKLLDEAYKE